MREQARRKGFGARGGAGGGLSLSLSLSHAKTRCRGSRVSCPRFFLALSFFLPSLLSLSLSLILFFSRRLFLSNVVSGAAGPSPQKKELLFPRFFYFPWRKLTRRLQKAFNPRPSLATSIGAKP